MHITSLATALLLPLLAAAQDASLSTTTMTSTLVMTQTITLSRVVATTTSTWSGNTTMHHPTGTGFLPSTTKGPGPSGSSPVVPVGGNGAGAAFGSISHVAVAGAAALVLAVLV